MDYIFIIKYSILGRTSIQLYTDREKFWHDFELFHQQDLVNSFKVEFAVLKDGNKIMLEGDNVKIANSCILDRF